MTARTEDAALVPTPDRPDDVPGPLAAWVETFTRLMDDVVRVPGTNIRFGLDAVLGLFPGAGDVVSAVASLSVLALAVREGVPMVVLVRMILNLGIDALVGAVPALGTIFDVYYKANRRNLTLLEAHRGGRVRRRDTLLVWVLLALAMVILAVPLVAAVALSSWLLSVALGA